MPKDIGRLLKRAEEIRLVADYTGDLIEPNDATELVGQAELFVGVMREIFMRGQSDKDG